MNRQWSLALAGTLLLVTGCSERDHVVEVPAAAPTPQTLTGEVFYREQYYLPPGANLNIILQTASEAGSPPVVIATSKTLLAGSQPYRFALDYSPADIDENKQYTLHATITFYGELLLTSATRLDPFKHPEAKIAIRVTPVGPPAP